MNQVSAAWKSLVQSTRRVIVRTVIGTTIVIGTLELTTELPSKGRASWFYHYLADDVGTPLLRKFLDPECTFTIDDCVCLVVSFLYTYASSSSLLP
jgi:hypothetical protein